MRLRFSLRTLMVLAALVAAGCYWWIARPTLVARQFVAAVERGDFGDADPMIGHAGARFLADWAENRWAFRVQANVEPLTFGRICRGQRDVRVIVNTFEFDQHVDRQFRFVATPLAMKSHGTAHETRAAISIGIENISR